MKIVHITEPLSGGVATFIKSLVQNMPYDTHIIIHGERKDEIPATEVKKSFNYTNVKFIKWSSAQRSLHPVKDISAFAELYTILKQLKQNNNFDVIHLHSSKSGFIGRIVCRLLGLQNIVFYTPNGASFVMGKSKTQNFLYKNLEKLGGSFGGQVVCCSNSEQKAYAQAGISAVTINNGIQYTKVAAPTKTLKKDGVFRVVASGRIVPQKNPALFNKIATYFEEFKQFEFIWIGDGSDKNLLTAKNIHITGWITPNEVNALLSRADLYLSTALYEGLSFAALEALALKKPVLLTNCVGNKDVVLNGLNGDLFNNHSEAINKILRFYNNASMLTVMGNYSAKHCNSNFNITDTFKNYKTLYQTANFVPSTPSSIFKQNKQWPSLKIMYKRKIAT